MHARTRALLLHCLRHDVVDVAAAGAGRSGSSLFGGVLGALFIGTLVAGAARGMAPGSALPCCFGLLGLFALVDAAADVGVAFLDARDLPLLRMLPIAPRDYLKARLAALALPIGVKGLALGLAPALAMTLAHGVALGLSFLVGMLLLEGTLAATAVLLLLLVRRLVPAARLRDWIAWLRALLLVGGTAAWLLFLRGAPPAAGESGADWWEHPALPTTWFAQLALVAAPGCAARASGVAAALATLAVTVLGFALLAPGYVRVLEGVERARPLVRRRAPLRALFERLFVRADEVATFRLGAALLRRERTFRLQTLPLLAYPLLFLALGRGQADGGLFGLLFSLMPAMVYAIASIYLRYSDSPQGGWFAEFLASDRAPLAAGARKAMWYTVVLPIGLVVGAVLAWDRGLAFGAGVGAMALFVATAVALTAEAPLPDVPFSRAFGGRLELGGDGARVYVLLLVFVVLGLVEWQLLRHGAAGLALLGAAGAAGTVVLLRGRRRRIPDVEVARAPSAGLEVEVPAVRPLPFGVRLRREIKGLVAFFALAGTILAAFLHWI